MKTTLMTVIVIFFTVQSIAQISISNTKWKGQAEVSQLVTVILDFRADTFFIFGRPDNEPETMVFS